MSTGRNFDEILRALDSLQLTARENVATPANWKPGEDVIIPTSVSDDAARQKYPQGFKTHKPYLRTVSHVKKNRGPHQKRRVAGAGAATDRSTTRLTQD